MRSTAGIPYVCLTVFVLGSLVRFDTAQYTWRSGSSQLLRKRQFRWGSNLFHVGILVVIAGHFVGFLMPDWAVDWLISPAQHELLAMVVGGLAGLIAIVGLSLLIHRRLTDPRIRATSRRWDIAIILMLWVQLALGLLTIPVSAQHMDGALFMTLVAYIKGIVLLHPGAADLLVGTPIDLPGAYPAGLYRLPGLSVHPPGAHMERAGLVSRPPRLPDRAQPAEPLEIRPGINR